MVGRELGLPANMVDRQPFPGPGLGVRCTGAITRDRILAEVPGICRVCYELSPKPIATVEWE